MLVELLMVKWVSGAAFILGRNGGMFSTSASNVPGSCQGWDAMIPERAQVPIACEYKPKPYPIGEIKFEKFRTLIANYIDQ